MPNDLAQRCVLVVDDSKFVRTTFASILRPSFAVREEADGEAGWAALESDPSIVMVLTDLDMPKLTGFALIGRIRAATDPRIRDLPVVVISGNEEPGSKVRTEDSVARTAEAAFMVVAAGTAAPQMLALAQRLQRELDEAKVTYRGTALRFISSFGVASLSLDPVDSIEELMRLAMQRLKTASSLKAAPEPSGPQRLPGEIERALQVLEKADAARLGAGVKQLLKRLQRIAKKL